VVKENFFRDEEGHTSIEYALLASIASVTILAALITLQADITTLYAELVEATGGAAP